MFDISGLGVFSVGKLTGLLYLLSVLPSLQSYLSHSNISKELRPLWLFFIFLTIVSLFNINSKDSAFFDFSIFQNLILLVIIINHERKDPGILLNAFFVYSLGTTLLAFLALQGIGISYSADKRMTIFNDNQNVIGMRMTISIIIISFIIIRNKNNASNLRYLLFIPLFILFPVMLATGSRVAILTLAMAFFLGLFLIMKKSSIFKKVVVVLIGIALFRLLVNVVNNNELIMSRLEKADDGDLSQRDVIWAKILPMINESPICGIGSTGYTEKISKYYYGEYASPHNVILEVLVNTGIIGFTFFIIFLVYVFVISYRYFNKSNETLALLLLMPIAGLILSAQILNVKVIYIIFAFAISRKFYLIKQDMKFVK